jgi:hypothetical protein
MSLPRPDDERFSRAALCLHTPAEYDRARVVVRRCPRPTTTPARVGAPERDNRQLEDMERYDAHLRLQLTCTASHLPARPTNETGG